MDGTLVQKLFISEVSALLDTYKQFETLIPSKEENHKGSYHKAEDGRFVENLVRSLLAKYLPKDLEVLTGFILRPAVKTGRNNRSRENDKDEYSTQLDVIVYDSAHYPVFLRYDNTAIVPPEGVVAIISIKKKLSAPDVKDEMLALQNASKLCRVNGRRGPFLSIIAMDTTIGTPKAKSAMKGYIVDSYGGGDIGFDDTVGLIGVINKWSLFKIRPQKDTPKHVEYKCFEHKQADKRHFCLQFLISGILSVFYGSSRKMKRPGFTAFPPTDAETLYSLDVTNPAVIESEKTDSNYTNNNN